jgi:hypothetical protein
VVAVNLAATSSKPDEAKDLVCSIFATMLPPRVDPRSLAVVIASLCIVACAGQRTRDDRSAPPRSDFLLSSADSTFWITTDGEKTRTRGAPLTLARYGGRFYELYTADDDFSYEDALLLGERLYRRDVLTGDSAVVFADTTVARVASSYGRAHPDEQPLSPNEEGDADPATSATAEVDILDVFGPYISYEYHVDIDLPGRRPWHSTRRGVLDLRSGKPASVSDLFGQSTGRRLESTGRHVYEAQRDSILRARVEMGAQDRRAAAALARLRFDERSFVLTDIDGQPAVSFGVPGQGEGSAGRLVQLEPLKTDSASPAWWTDVRADVPTTDDQGNDRWDGAGYQIVARYDTSGETARISITDSSRREWPLATVSAPLRRVDWLDHPAIGDADRRALTRAFNEAATYGEVTRVAVTRTPAILSLVTRSGTSHAYFQARQRQSARDVRAHDARSREQPGARVRGRDPVDDGQMRCHRRASSYSNGGRHGVDRPGRLSRTDPLGRSGRHEGERQLCGTNVNGGRCPRGGGGLGDGQSPAHKLVLFDVRCG